MIKIIHYLWTAGQPVVTLPTQKQSAQIFFMNKTGRFLAPQISLTYWPTDMTTIMTTVL